MLGTVFVAGYVGVFLVSAVVAATRLFVFKDSTMLGDTFIEHGPCHTRALQHIQGAAANDACCGHLAA